MARSPTARYADQGVPKPILAFNRKMDLELWSQASAEAQIAAVADDIAYDAHDIDDGLRAELFGLEELRELPLIGDILGGLTAEHPMLEPFRRVHEVQRRLITRMIEDAIAQTRTNIAALGIGTVQEVRAAAQPVVGLSSAMLEADRAIKGFLYPRMYRHSRIMRIMGDAEGVVCDLFARYAEQPRDIPAEWAQAMHAEDEGTRLRRIADFIAGMTDRYALIEHARLFPSTPELR
jgi:dGTPase